MNPSVVCLGTENKLNECRDRVSKEASQYAHVGSFAAQMMVFSEIRRRGNATHPGTYCALGHANWTGMVSDARVYFESARPEETPKLMSRDEGAASCQAT
jgi:hypothetical protein